MSTSASITEIQQLRSEIIKFNAEARMLSNIAMNGRFALRDYMTIIRLMTGGNPELMPFIASMQTTISVAQTASIALRAAQLSMGPIGWALLGIGTFVGILGMEQAMRPPG